MISAYPKLHEAQTAIDEGRFVEAAQFAMAHARSHPNEPRGLALLGISAMRMGALWQAESFLRKSLAIEDRSATLRELGVCLNQQEKLPEAIEIFRTLEARGDTDPQIGVFLALTLDKLGRPDEARSTLEGVLERYPNHCNALLAYALNLRAAGRIEESVAAYRRVSEIDPERGDAWWGIASIKQSVFTEDDIAAMKKVASVATDVADAAPLNFALGRAHQERQEYEQAFLHFSEANRLWAESIQYRQHELVEEVDETRQLFGSEFFADEKPEGNPSNAPIFIVSLPRSGSTLLEQMLGCHRDIEPLGEMPHIPAMLRSVMEKAMRRGIRSVPQAVRALAPDELAPLGSEYLRRAALHSKSDAPRFIDKLPHNWSNSLLIHRMLPNAKIIDIRRDALDCCFSNFTHSFSRAHASSFALEDIGRTYVDYVRYMDHLDEVAPGLIHHVSYERLVENPEEEIRAILEYLELPWDEACLHFHESDRTVRTPSAEQVRRPLNRSGMGIWKPYEEWLKPLFDVLGPLADRSRERE